MKVGVVFNVHKYIIGSDQSRQIYLTKHALD